MHALRYLLHLLLFDERGLLGLDDSGAGLLALRVGLGHTGSFLDSTLRHAVSILVSLVAYILMLGLNSAPRLYSCENRPPASRFPPPQILSFALGVEPWPISRMTAKNFLVSFISILHESFWLLTR